MADNKKLFLDYAGLTSLWNKMKSTFAGKAATEESIRTINGSISQINTNVGVLDAEIDTVNANVVALTPKTAANYSAALAQASASIPGTIINVTGAETVNGALYVGGFYIVESKDPASIKYLGTSTGSADDDEVAALTSRVQTLEDTVITSAKYTDGVTTKSFDVTDGSLVIRYDDKFVANSDSINALTHKAIAIKFGEIESMISSVPKFKIAVIDGDLPDSDISTSTIYLKKNDDVTSNNLYTEYIYIEGVAGSEGKWEKLGEQTLDITNYYNKTEVENLLNSKVSNLATTDFVSNSISTAKNEVLGTVSSTYVRSADLENIVLTSITEGAIGEAMAISVDQIEGLE